MGRFDISPEVEKEYREKFRDSVQPHVDEDVLAVGTFRQTGSGTKYAISKARGGALAYGAAGLIGKKRAGRLPETFLLAVTPTKVHAFKYKLKRNGVAIREHVAEWDRSGLEVGVDQRKTTRRLTLESPGDAGKVVCDADGMGHNPWADEVIRELG